MIESQRDTNQSQGHLLFFLGSLFTQENLGEPKLGSLPTAPRSFAFQRTAHSHTNQTQQAHLFFLVLPQGKPGGASPRWNLRLPAPGAARSPALPAAAPALAVAEGRGAVGAERGGAATAGGPGGCAGCGRDGGRDARRKGQALQDKPKGGGGILINPY